ncbi:hypothetical protein V6N11_049967 [Hibiscus sabdariffa]|uniref:Uncharacterized protein n=1 Tax=Hibiscus sabdariffa TaxID=183260 RepID=A0ABR2T8F3_9ROSI
MGKSCALQGNALIEDVREMLSRNWSVVIRSIPRAMHKVADELAALLRDCLVGVKLFDTPPVSVITLVHMDKFGDANDVDNG